MISGIFLGSPCTGKGLRVRGSLMQDPQAEVVLSSGVAKVLKNTSGMMAPSCQTLSLFRPDLGTLTRFSP